MDDSPVFSRDLWDIVFGPGENPSTVAETASKIGVSIGDHVHSCIDFAINDGLVADKHEVFRILMKELGPLK